jgi:AcrR family transcriptional regulator
MTPTGLRERKKLETRLALRSAALRLTAERGIDHVTVEDIAAAADVSTRTFFNYFSNKEEAVVGSDPEWLAQVLTELAERPVDEEPLFALEAVFQGFASLLVQDREVHLTRRKVMADNPSLLSRRAAAFDEFERALVNAIRERMGADATTDAESALVVAAAVAAMKVSVDLWLDSEDDTELPQLLHRAIDRLAGGLVPPTARRKTHSTKSHPARTTLQKDLR